MRIFADGIVDLQQNFTVASLLAAGRYLAMAVLAAVTALGLRNRKPKAVARDGNSRTRGMESREGYVVVGEA